MKKGKIILGAAAALVAIGSSLAFKVSHNFVGGLRVYANTTNSSTTKCPVTCRSLRTVTASGTQFTTCITVGGRNIGIAHNINTFYKEIASDTLCINPVTLLHKTL